MGRTKGIKCPECIRLRKRIESMECIQIPLLNILLRNSISCFEDSEPKKIQKLMNGRVRDKVSRTSPKFVKTSGKKYVQKKGAMIWKSKPSIKTMINKFCSSTKTTNHKIKIKHRCAYFLDALVKGNLQSALVKYYGNSAVKFRNGQEEMISKKLGVTKVESIIDTYLARLTNPEYVAPKRMVKSLDKAIYSTYGFYSPLLQWGTMPLRKKAPDPITTEPDVDIRLGAQKFLQEYAPLKNKQEDYQTRRKVWDMTAELVKVFRSSDTSMRSGIEDAYVMMEEYAQWLNYHNAYGLNLGISSNWWTHFADEVLHLIMDN